MKAISLPYKFKKTLALSLLFLSAIFINAQKKTYRSATVGFYNLENLFDIYESAGYINGYLNPQDELYHTAIKVTDIPSLEAEEFNSEFTEENLKNKKVIRHLILQKEHSPEGPKAWDSIKYHQKLTNLSRAISEMGRDVTGEPPVAVGVAEVETREALQDLISTPALKPFNYGIVHYNSMDSRGIDCGFIYQKDRVTVTNSRKYEVKAYSLEGKRIYTRDIIRIDALLDGEPIHFLVNHWPSRFGGQAASEPNRIVAAKVMRGIFDEIRKDEPEAKIIAMGDFNDDPVNYSMSDALNAVGDKKELNENTLYNPMIEMYKKGFGTLAYRDGWNLFDQFIMTPVLLQKNYDSYRVFKTDIFSPAYLISKEGKYKGYPQRMYGGDTYHVDGYSDHFPVYTILIKEVK